MADKTNEIVLREFFDQIPPESGRLYEVSSTPEGKTLIKDVTVYQQDGTPWTAADAAMAINGLPPIGDITFAFYRIAYPGGDVNSKTFPWVNFDDNLLPEKYPQLYALYGSTLSVGAPSGYFNLAKLKDRFPLVSSSNSMAVGGEATVALTGLQNGSHTHGVRSFFSSATTGVEVQIMGGSSYAGSQTLESGKGEPHNNMPPYVKMIAHLRSG